MSKLEVDKITPQSGTTLTIGDSGDTIVIDSTSVSGAKLAAPTLVGSASSAGSILFKEDTDNGTNAVTLKGPAATADVTLNLPAANDTIVGRATTDTLTNKTINGSQIINSTLALDKLANGTDGNIISYDANGAIVAVATGNDGQVLTSTGAGSPPAFETLPAGGSWVLVNTQTVSGTPTTIEPGAVFSATYDTYVVVIRRYNNASGGGFQLQLGTSGGYTTSGYRWNVDGGGGTGSALNSGVAGSSIIDLLGGTSSTYHVNSSQDCLSGVIWIHNPFNSGRTSIHAELSWENATDLDAHIANVGGHPNTNTQYDRWKLICPSSSQTFEATTIIQTFGVVNA